MEEFTIRYQTIEIRLSCTGNERLVTKRRLCFKCLYANVEWVFINIFYVQAIYLCRWMLARKFISLSNGTHSDHKKKSLANVINAPKCSIIKKTFGGKEAFMVRRLTAREFPFELSIRLHGSHSIN